MVVSLTLDPVGQRRGRGRSPHGAKLSGGLPVTSSTGATGSSSGTMSTRSSAASTPRRISARCAASSGSTDLRGSTATERRPRGPQACRPRTAAPLLVRILTPHGSAGSSCRPAGRYRSRGGLPRQRPRDSSEPGAANFRSSSEATATPRQRNRCRGFSADSGRHGRLRRSGGSATRPEDDRALHRPSPT